MPAGARALPFRSNIPKISKFAFDQIDSNYFDRAMSIRNTTGHFIVAGKNYGQGSSREHAALSPHYLGLHVVIAISFARIHSQNLINFGVLPIQFVDEVDYSKINKDDILKIEGIHKF
jgi:aconitate hydratase